MNHKRIIRAAASLFCAATLVLSCVTGSASAVFTQPEIVQENAWTETEIDIIANVVTHEVGGISGYVRITYADGRTEEYSDGGCILHQIHARVLMNQKNSDLFPSSLASCVRTYWMAGLEYPGYYGSGNQTWQHCREDVVDALDGDICVPSNVYAATCDPYFATWCPGYRLWASVYWNTGWYSGVFYYYQY